MERIREKQIRSEMGGGRILGGRKMGGLLYFKTSRFEIVENEHHFDKKKLLNSNSSAPLGDVACSQTYFLYSKISVIASQTERTVPLQGVTLRGDHCINNFVKAKSK